MNFMAVFLRGPALVLTESLIEISLYRSDM